MIGLTATASIFALLWTSYVIYWWRKKKFSYFQEIGVPGPKPSLLFGNLLEIRRRGAATLFAEWIKKYGNIVGFYNGAVPFLLVNDLRLLSKVEIEDFHNFAERGIVFEVEDLPDFDKKNIATAPLNRWREMRAVLSPAFTTKKLSQIFVIMDECTDTMIKLLEKKAITGEAVELTKIFRRTTMDTMFKAGYGIDLDVQNSTPGGPLDQMGDGAGVLVRSVPLQGLPFLSNCFPELRLLWFLLSWVTSRLVIPYFAKATKLIEPVLNDRRSKALHQKADVLQLLLNKETRGKLFENGEHGFDGQTRLALTKEEVIANSALYLIAGLEATPNIMALTLHLLAHHPEVQERLREEIMGVLQRDNQFTDKNVLKMQYMDSVLSESMRFYTGIVGFVTRRAAKTYEYEGVKIPKGLSVMVPVSYLHQDPEVWREPGNFDPERNFRVLFGDLLVLSAFPLIFLISECDGDFLSFREGADGYRHAGRFSSENRSRIHPVSFQPFGKGPRECLGRNFALLEMKIMLAKFLANFKVSVDEEHHKELIKLGSTFIASVVPNGVWMKLEKVRT